MAKNELDLDNELNNNLDFLEDHEFDVNQNSGAISSKKLFNANKVKIITVIIIISIILLTVIFHIKKQSRRHSMLVAIPQEQTLSAAVAPSATNSSTTMSTVAPATVTSTPEIPVIPTNIIPPSTTSTANNNLSWQDLKNTVADTTTTPTVPTQPVKTDQVPVGGFEHQKISPVTQIQANHADQENINQLKTTIENITNELTTNVNQIKELQNNLREITRSLSNVSGSIHSIDSKILNLTNTVDNLSMNVKKYTQDEDLDLTATLKPSEADLFSNTPEYLVHAVIPGRAWLKSSSGQIITVAEGDSLGDYGKIALIDAANNLVRTSSGVVFR